MSSSKLIKSNQASSLADSGLAIGDLRMAVRLIFKLYCATLILCDDRKQMQQRASSWMSQNSFPLLSSKMPSHGRVATLTMKLLELIIYMTSKCVIIAYNW